MVSERMCSEAEGERRGIEVKRTQFVGVALAAAMLCAPLPAVAASSSSDQTAPPLAAALPVPTYASPAVFQYQPPQDAPTMRLVDENALFKKYLVQFPSALVTPYAKNRVVSAMYYVPQGRSTFPVIVVLPHLSGGMIAERYIARGLVRAGFGVLHVTEPYYFPFDTRRESWLASAKDLNDLVQVIHLLRQAVINTRQAVDWVVQQPGVDRERIGLMGISMGGWVGVLVAGADTRIKSCVYMLAGGDISMLVLQSGLTSTLRKGLQEHGVSMEDIQVVSSVIDPLNMAEAARRNRTLMLNATFDDTVPRECTERLWEALGRPPIFWVPTGHESSLLFRWYFRQKVVRHFMSTLLQ